MIDINKTYNENCLDTMKRMDDNFIKLTITSPPYDDLRTYNKKIGSNTDQFNGHSFPFEEIAKELYRVTQKGGVVVWVVSDAVQNGSETGTSFRQALYFKEMGFNIHDTMIYRKLNPPPNAGTRYQQMFEYMFVFSKGKPNQFNPIMKKNATAGAVRHSRKFRNTDGEMVAAFNGKPINEYGIENNIWLIKNGMNKSTKDEVAFKHPAIFPEELALKHIITWTKENDLVYDPFMGSGTTAKLAIQLGRNWIGSELDEEYSKICLERIENIQKDDSIMENIITKDSI
jgi:site-specific DNA-methyltransferase (adenine-specific)